MKIYRPFTKTIILVAAFATAMPIPSLTVNRAAGSSPEGYQNRQKATLPVFIQNKGQWADSLYFRTDAGDATIWFARNGIYYQFVRIEKGYNGPDGSRPYAYKKPLPLQGRIETMIIGTSFIGANPDPAVVGQEMSDCKYNYFIGNNRNGWRTSIPGYQMVHYRNIYNGIDLKYYGIEGHIEYDFTAWPGADLSKIRIRYNNVEEISLDDEGNLLIETEWGIIREARPIIYQNNDGSKCIVEGKYKVISANIFGFDVHGDYDPSLPLVIDPSLSFSTYLGGGNVDVGNSLAVDDQGAVYVVGRTRSTDFPAVNEYQGYQAGYDAFITKLHTDGSSPIYSTYIGGSSSDEAFDIAIDAGGNVYVTGYTRSANFPIENEYQTHQGGADVFALKLNSNGNGLVYSTYIGGDNDDLGYSLAIDEDGYSFITGTTISANFPLVGEYQTNQPYYDVFVTKLNTVGDDLISSTYIGGDQDETGYDIGLDGDGNIYIAGETFSTDYPVQSEYQTDHSAWDAFITKLNSAASSLVYSTYLGGDGDDKAYGIAIGNGGIAYITGVTGSTDFPTENPFQADQTGNDVFVAKLNGAGTGLIYSTYIGGIGDEAANSITIDNYGSAYITGQSSDDSYPVNDPLQTYQALTDIFITKLNSAGDGLDFSSYLGGDGDETATAIVIDAEANAYVTGYTFSTDFPIFNPYQTDLVQADVFISKVAIGAFICGDADGDEAINILDIVYIINYVYKSGPAPDPLQSADVDGVAGINILDIVYLINYIYKNGPEPDCT